MAASWRFPICRGSSDLVADAEESGRNYQSRSLPVSLKHLIRTLDQCVLRAFALGEQRQGLVRDVGSGPLIGIAGDGIAVFRR
jgi:hypothetical protein